MKKIRKSNSYDKIIEIQKKEYRYPFNLNQSDIEFLLTLKNALKETNEENEKVIYKLFILNLIKMYS